MQKEEICTHFIQHEDRFNLIEFGAGDGFKTKLLLQHLLLKKVDFTYMPVDISGNVLDILTADLKENMPELSIKGLANEYFSALEELNSLDNTRKVILFLGSNIGNFTYDQALTFLKNIQRFCNPQDQILIGFDLMKDPSVILQAYGDPNGITKSFNLNLLERINRELEGNFELGAFEHFPMYDPRTGTTTSFLISKKEQEVKIAAIDLTVKFKAWEAIHMEISQKYNHQMIEDLALSSGFEVKENFYDCKHYYLDSIWKLKK